MGKIHDATVGDPDIACPFTTPAFHLSFKVLHKMHKMNKQIFDKWKIFKNIFLQVIRESIWLLKDQPKVVEQGISILYEHAGLEGCDVEENGLCEIDVLHPKYLPRKEMLSLLIDLLTYMTANQSVWIFLFSFCFDEKLWQNLFTHFF